MARARFICPGSHDSRFVENPETDVERNEEALEKVLEGFPTKKAAKVFNLCYNLKILYIFSSDTRTLSVQYEDCTWCRYNK